MFRVESCLYRPTRTWQTLMCNCSKSFSSTLLRSSFKHSLQELYTFRSLLKVLRSSRFSLLTSYDLYASCFHSSFLYENGIPFAETAQGLAKLQVFASHLVSEILLKQLRSINKHHKKERSPLDFALFYGVRFNSVRLRATQNYYFLSLRHLKYKRYSLSSRDQSSNVHRW